MSSTLIIGKNEIIDKVNSPIASKTQLEDQLVAIQVSMLDLNIEQIAKESITVSDIRFIYKLVQNLDSKILRLFAERITHKSDNLVIIYIYSYTGEN